MSVRVALYKRTIAGSCVPALFNLVTLTVWHLYEWILKEKEQRIVLDDRHFPPIFFVIDFFLCPIPSLSPEMKDMMTDVLCHEPIDGCDGVFSLLSFVESAYPIMFQ